MGWEVRG